jgi:hypothetical protein
MKLFFFGEKNTLDRFTLQELREMQIQLEKKSESLRKQIADLEEEIAFLFEKAKQAKTRADEVSLARKIKTLQEKLKMKSNAQVEIEKELRAVNNIAILKEHEEDLKVAGIWGRLRKMDPEKLDKELRERTLDAQDRERLTESVIALTGEVMAAGAGHEEDLDEILDTIRSVKKGEMEPEAASKKVSREKDLE